MARGTAVENQAAIAAYRLSSVIDPRNTHGSGLAFFREAEIATQNIAHLPLIHGVEVQARSTAIEQLLAQLGNNINTIADSDPQYCHCAL